jgi:hypothetical protein
MAARAGSSAMPPVGWQKSLLDDLRRMVEADADVVALVLFGSLAAEPASADAWSDIDVILAVRPGTTGRFFPDATWLSPFGAIWTHQAVSKEHTSVLLVCFDDGRRLDVVILEDPGTHEIPSWDDNPFRGATRVLFSRSGSVDPAVASAPAGVPHHGLSDDQFAAMSDAFWFGAQAALRKLVRGDLLIASHLALGLARDCLVLEMMARDSAARASYHPHGAPTDAAALDAASHALRALTREGVLAMICASAERFDALAGRVSPAYVARAAPLLAMAESARTAMDARVGPPQPTDD